MKWTFKIKGIEKREKKVVVYYDLLLDKSFYIADSVFIDSSAYKNFTDSDVEKLVEEEVLKKSYSEISQEMLFTKLSVKVDTEMEFKNANLGS